MFMNYETLWNAPGQLNMEVLISQIVSNLEKKAYMLSLWRLTSRVGWLLSIIYLFVCLFLQSHSVMFSCTAVGSILRWLSYGKKLAELFSMRSKWGFPHSSTHLEIKLYSANWRRLPLKPTVSCDSRYSLEIQYYSTSCLVYYGKQQLDPFKMRAQ